MGEIRANLAKQFFGPQPMMSLPVAEWQPGNVVKIAGYGGFWSEAPLLNPNWLNGRMTQEESDGFTDSQMRAE